MAQAVENKTAVPEVMSSNPTESCHFSLFLYPSKKLNFDSYDANQVSEFVN